MQRWKNNPAGKGDASVNRAMRDIGGTQIEEEDRVSEAIILVGAIPCPMMGPA
jgi:hypothetical protein